MEKKASIIYVLIVLVLSVSSCSKEQYSCDPTADAWVKENLSTIKTMTRSDWVSLNQNQSVKRAVYVAFSDDSQRLFWEDKISEVIDQFNWNEKEIAHLSSLLDYIKTTDIFYKEDVDDDFELFVYRWNEYAENELQWTKKLRHAITANGETLLSKDGNLPSQDNHTATPITKSSSREIDSYDCYCSISDDWCAGVYDPGIIPSKFCACPDTCAPTTGCGTFFQFRCDGICVQWVY